MDIVDKSNGRNFRLFLLCCIFVVGVISGCLKYISSGGYTPPKEPLIDMGDVEIGGGQIVNVQKRKREGAVEPELDTFKARKVTVPMPTTDGKCVSLTADSVIFKGFDKPMLLENPVLKRFHPDTGKLITKTTSDTGTILFTQGNEGSGLDSVQLKGDVKIHQYEALMQDE